MMKRTPKTPALAKLAMLLLFAIAAVAILDTTSISAQELGRTITSPFGVANPYMNASDASESGSNGDTFVDPETGEVGHIIRNPFGVANPEGVDTGIDIPENAGEEVGGIITSPFGVPASDDIDTGVGVFEEDEEYLISLPDDEESEVEESENVDEVDDETSDDEKEIGEESYEATTEKYVPVIDNPIRGVEHPSFNFELTCSSAGASVTDSGDVSVTPTLCVLPGKTIQTQAVLSEGSWPSGAPTWTLTCQTYESLPYGVSDLSLPSYANGLTNLPTITVPSGMPYRKYILTASAENISRNVQIVVLGRLDLQIDSNNNGVIEDNDDSVEETAPGKIIFTNDGDLDQDGIPDCYDGFDIKVNGNGVSQSGNMKSEAFTPIKIYMRGLSNLIASNQNVSIRLSYPAASPQNETITGAGTDDDPYVFSDSNKCLRIWTKDGTLQRNKKSISSSGDFIPSDTPISLSSYKNANVIISDTINLFVEAKNEPDTQNPVEITCSIKINSSASNVMSDTVKVSSVSRFVLRAIDISGYMSPNPNLEIQRIPANEDVDGIATDHLNGVPDGAALLLSLEVHPLLLDYYNPQSVALFVPLPQSQGSYDYNIPSNIPGVSIPQLGTTLPSERKVIKQIIYLPPMEMGANNKLSKTINLIAELNVNTQPNSYLGQHYYARKPLILTRPPVLMVHGINGTSKSVFDDSGFSDAMNAAGIMAYGVDHNNKLIDSFTKNATLGLDYSNDPTYFGNGDIVTSYQFLRDRICHNNSFLLGPNESPERDAKIKPVLPMYRTGLAIPGKKIAIQKVDVVAYSYGGLLARWYVEKSSEFSNRRDVRKIITIGTPHRGSPITNMMCESYKNSVFADAISGWLLQSGFLIKDLWGFFAFIGKVKWFKQITTPAFIENLNLSWDILFDFLEHPVNQFYAGIESAYSAHEAYNDYKFMNSSIFSILGTDCALDINLYEALHVIAHGSVRLEELNCCAEPLHADVAYASIVGMNPYLYGLQSSWAASNPKYNYHNTSFTAKSYFPWAEGLEKDFGNSDGIVPEMSQRLITGDDTNVVFCVDKSHLGEVGYSETQGRVITWLKSPNMKRGGELRSDFQSLTNSYLSDRYDIYSQQSINFSNQYEDTGVNPDAIVQTVLTMPASNPSYLTDNILGPHGGVVTIKCTGMVPDNGRTLSIIADGSLAAGYNDTVLHGPFSLTGPACPYGIYLHKLKSFSITGTIGRSICSIPGIPGSWNELRGPNDYVGVRWDITDSWDIGYEIDGSSYYGFELQSPPTRMEFSTEPVLDPLVKEETSLQPPSQPPFQISGPTNFIARGGFHVSEDAVSSAARTQQITIKIYDEDTVLDDLLVNKTISVVHAPNVFAGILMPYETSIELTKDNSGYVSGAQGSSGESTAQVYQELIELSGISNPESQTVDITAN